MAAPGCALGRTRGYTHTFPQQGTLCMRLAGTRECTATHAYHCAQQRTCACIPRALKNAPDACVAPVPEVAPHACVPRARASAACPSTLYTGGAPLAGASLAARLIANNHRARRCNIWPMIILGIDPGLRTTGFGVI